MQYISHFTNLISHVCKMCAFTINSDVIVCEAYDFIIVVQYSIMLW